MTKDNIKSSFPNAWAKLVEWQKASVQNWQKNIAGNEGQEIPEITDEMVEGILQSVFGFPNWNFLYDFFDKNSVIMTLDYKEGKGFIPVITNTVIEDYNLDRVIAEKAGFMRCFELVEQSLSDNQES